MNQQKQQKQCEFCKTSMDAEAIICPSCGATHLYYQHDRDQNGETYQQALETRQKIERWKALAPRLLLALALTFGATWALAGLSWGSDFSFAMALVCFPSFVFLIVFGVIWLTMTAGNKHFYDKPKRVWRRKI